MSDKKVNKVTYAGETLVDLTADTVTPETLRSGYTAHAASGEQIVGTYEEKDFVGATASADGQHGLVPAPPKAAVNGDYALLPTGDWGRLKALGYYTATANTNPDSPANKIVSVLVKSGIAASLASKLPSTNGQNYISIPSNDGNEYAQVSFDTTGNIIYFRTRKKVNNVDTWTEWEPLAFKDHTHTKSQITDFPTSMPASDVPAWAKASTKPSYTKSEVGLGNVGNFKAVSTVANQGLTDAEKTNARANIGAQAAGSYAAASHKHGNDDITGIDAGKITSGTIGIDRLPHGALERLVLVEDNTARFKLTPNDVQKGDTVKVRTTKLMYFVVDDTKLSSEDGYEIYSAGSATAVPWSGVTDKPTSFTPSSHTHDDRYYTETEMDAKLNSKVDLSADGVSKAINQLTTGTSTPTDADYYVSQYAGGETTTTSYHRRPMSALWSYIKSKADKVYSAIGHNHDTAYLKLAGGTVSGTLVLSKTQDLSGSADNKPALIVGGVTTAQHIEMDGNEIQSKSNGTTPSPLYINQDGGEVHLAKSGVKTITKGPLTVEQDVTLSYDSTNKCLNFVFS